MGLFDLCLITLCTAVADHNCGCDLLVEYQLHGVVLVLYHIEVGYINDIVALKCVLAVYRLRIGGALEQLYVAGIGFLLALYISSAAKVILTKIGKACSDAGNRRLVAALHYCIHPALITGDHLRCAGSYVLIVGEQLFNAVKAVCKVVVVLSVDADSVLKRADRVALRDIQDIFLIGMAEPVLIVSAVALKNIVLHFLVLLFLAV